MHTLSKARHKSSYKTKLKLQGKQHLNKAKVCWKIIQDKELHNCQGSSSHSLPRSCQNGLSSARVCLLCQVLGHCLDLLVCGINLIQIAYQVKGISCLNLLKNLDILEWKTYHKSSKQRTSLERWSFSKIRQGKLQRGHT